VAEQYDSMVGTANASTNAPSDAAVVLAKGTGKALAMTVDCNSKYVFANPYIGCSIAVAEAALNIVSSGGEPLGLTNCLNFGNPYDPEVYFHYVEAIKGMGNACRAFNTPVTGGNVSFYNQNPDGPVYPTPTIGMVGIIDDFKNRMTLDFKNVDDVIVLVGHQVNDIGSSEYLYKIKKEYFSPAPYFNLEEELWMQRFLLQLIKNHAILSAHDISEGGLIITLMEKGFNRSLRFEVSKTEFQHLCNEAFWLGEPQGRAVITCSAIQWPGIQQLANELNVPVYKIEKVTNDIVSVNNENWGSINAWKELYENAIGKFF
jgi:phosphoribosylformylglycinamidine synthase